MTMMMMLCCWMFEPGTRGLDEVGLQALLPSIHPSLQAIRPCPFHVHVQQTYHYTLTNTCHHLLLYITTRRMRSMLLGNRLILEEQLLPRCWWLVAGRCWDQERKLERPHLTPPPCSRSHSHTHTSPTPYSTPISHYNNHTHPSGINRGTISDCCLLPNRPLHTFFLLSTSSWLTPVLRSFNFSPPGLHLCRPPHSIIATPLPLHPST